MPPPHGLVSAQGQKIRIGEWLVEKGLISGDQLEVALLEQKRTQKLLGEVMVDLGFITENALAATLSESSGLERFDFRHSVLDADIVKIIPRQIAERYKILPVALTEREVRLAMADVFNVLAIDQARRYFPKGIEIIPLVASDTELADAIDTYYGYEMSIDGLLREIEKGDAASAVMTGEEGFVNPTVRLVNALILDAIKTNASDLHFEPDAMFVRLRYRIDGVMTQIRTFHKDYWASVCVRLKIMAGMNIAETRNPQDGRFSFNVGSREVDFRVASHPTIHGENIVIRVLDKAKSLVPLETLGYDESIVALLKKQLLRPEGIIIVTGPTGSGKTTTLYSILNYLNSMDVNIMTLEEPVEYQLALIRQSDVRDVGGMGFSEGVRSILRQDPDIVFVGEVRDTETATMALRAAMTGHQVFTTLHTNDAISAISRLVDLGLPPPMLAGNIILVMAQRLIRRLCRDCRQSYTADARECGIIGVDAATPPTLYKAVGCPKCRNTGYKGRTAVVEVVPFTSALDELVSENATRGTILKQARNEGVETMQENGLRKVLGGETSLEELIGTINMVERL
ncbi:MAG TPA: secretion system protein E [Rhodospirillaceae bacterium]|nr:MAG: secretion system protein E [Alphaproteobacteria bacterium GWF2_58_20]HAU29213.1 secretion system protein E [Rhodospirillaceae bacterium]